MNKLLYFFRKVCVVGLNFSGFMICYKCILKKKCESHEVMKHYIKCVFAVSAVICVCVCVCVCV